MPENPGFKSEHYIFFCDLDPVKGMTGKMLVWNAQFFLLNCWVTNRFDFAISQTK